MDVSIIHYFYRHIEERERGRGGYTREKKNYIRTKAHISIKVTFQIKNNLQHYNILLRASNISMVLENNNKKN